MADTLYKVVVDLSTQGDLAKGLDATHGKLGKIESAWGKIGEAGSSFASNLNDAFSGAVEKAGDLAAGFAKMAVAGGIAAATYGVMHLNNELEQTAISMGAIFNAQGFSGGDFDKAMTMAADQVTKMKQDIRTLPGDLGQLAAIMTTIATPAAQGGASPDDIRKTAGRSMLVGRIMQVPPEMVAREMANLLAGRAGSHNILGSRMGFIGDKAHALHEADPAERFKMVNAEMAKFDAAAGRLGTSWVALSTTIKDDVKYMFLADATAPLFEGMKKSLAEVHAWAEHNRAGISAMTGRLGEGLKHAWEVGTEEIVKWGPAIQSFAHDAFAEMHSLWTAVGPLISHAAEALRSALADGTALSKIESILKLYGAVKLGGMVGPGMMSGGGGLLKMAMGAGSTAAEGGPAGMAIGLAGAAAAAIALAAAAGTAAAVMDKGSDVHELAVAEVERLGAAFSKFGDTLSVNVLPMVERWAVDLTGKVATVFETLNDPIDAFRNALYSLGPQMSWLANVIHDYHRKGMLDTTDDAAPKVDRDFDVTENMAGRKAGQLTAIATAAAAAVGAKGGKGGTNIQKVEITVSSNQDPSRIARLVFSEMAALSRNPTASRAVPNFSANRTR